MTTIAFRDGKPVVRDGKVGTGQGCCCGYCCVSHCDCMCCTQIKWTLASSGGETQTLYSSIAPDCHAYLAIGGCIARATVKCNGYNPSIFEGLGKPQGCDTDCSVVNIEYCTGTLANLAACQWGNSPTGACAALTAEVYCPSGAAQPPATYPLPRGSSLIASSAQQCEARNGTPCPSLPCEEPCGFPCPPGPTEWRIIDDNGVVWFTGDVELNPQATPDVSPQRCSDPDDCDPQFKPKWILKDYPFSVIATNPWYSEFCPNGGPKAAPMYIGQSATLRLEVLGCSITWATVKGPQATTRPICAIGALQWEQEFGWLVLQQGCYSPNYYSPQVSSWTVAPGLCECLKDPNTGAPVMYDATGGASSPPVMKCRHCNNRMGGECGSGLEYLGHGMGVKYTNRNGDKDGSNLYNWEDAQGRYPAGWLPTEEYFGGPAKTDTDITIEGDMDTWRVYRLPTNNPPQFGNVTIKSPPGAFGFDVTKVYLGFWAETITVDNARLQGDGSPCRGNSGPPQTVRVGSLLTAKNNAIVRAMDIGPLRGSGLQCVFDTSSTLGIGYSPLFTTLTCDTCTFKKSTSGFGGSYFTGGTINGNVVFENNSTMSDVSRFGLAEPAVINGSATFKNNSYIEVGTINGNAEFYNSATIGYPYGGAPPGVMITISGNATLNNNSRMVYGSVTGTATFNDAACLSSGTAGTFVPNPPPAC